MIIENLSSPNTPHTLLPSPHTYKRGPPFRRHRKTFDSNSSMLQATSTIFYLNIKSKIKKPTKSNYFIHLRQFDLSAEFTITYLLNTSIYPPTYRPWHFIGLHRHSRTRQIRQLFSHKGSPFIFISFLHTPLSQ